MSFAAGTCYGKLNTDSSDVLYNRLVKEGALNSPTRPFEFVPIVTVSNNSFSNLFKKHCYITEDYTYTNLRNCIKYGLYLYCDNILMYKNFKVFRIKIPMFIRDQLMTHSTLSKINQSNRIGKLSDLYYCPKLFGHRISSYYNLDTSTYKTMYNYMFKLELKDL